MNAILAGLNQAALENGGTITDIMVLFLSNGNASTRRKRSTGTDCELEITVKKTIKKIETEVISDDFQVWKVTIVCDQPISSDRSTSRSARFCSTKF